VPLEQPANNACFLIRYISVCRRVLPYAPGILSQKTPKNDVAAMKKFLEETTGKMKGTISFSNETATGFDWKRETPNETFPDKPVVRESFFSVVEVDGKKIGCYPSNSSTKEEIERTREACKTLSKK
jgi:hypothetical protein